MMNRAQNSAVRRKLKNAFRSSKHHMPRPTTKSPQSSRSSLNRNGKSKRRPPPPPARNNMQKPKTPSDVLRGNGTVRRKNGTLNSNAHNMTGPKNM